MQLEFPDNDCQSFTANGKNQIKTREYWNQYPKLQKTQITERELEKTRKIKLLKSERNIIGAKEIKIRDRL